MDLNQKFTLCTLCLDPESELSDVFEYNERSFKLSFVIQELLQLKVTKQGRIPWMSCTKCIGKLKDFVRFRNNATKSINILKCLLFDKKKHHGNTWENGSRNALEEDKGHFNDPEENVSPGNLFDSVKDEPGSLDSHGVESEVALEEDNGHPDETEENVSPGNLVESVKEEPGNLDSQSVESEIAVEEDNGPFHEPGENVSPGNLFELVKDEPGSLDSHCVESEVALEEDGGHPDEPGENVSPGNLVESVKDEGDTPDSHVVESEMHVKSHNEPEILPAEECLSISGEISSFDGVQCSDAHISMSVHMKIVIHRQQVPLSEEVKDQDDLHLYLSSDSSDQTSDAEDRSAKITCPETEVTNLSFGGVTSVTVFGGGESVGNREETREGEKHLKGLKDSERRFSARLRLGAKVLVATHSHLKRRRIRSQCRNGNFGPDEDVESTPSSTTGKSFCEENGGHTERKEETRRESRHGNGALAGNISSGSSVGDEKSEGQNFICDECGKVFRSKDLIERHVKVPCGRELRDCGNSNKKFHTRKQHKRHRSDHCVRNVSKRREQISVAVDVSGESDGNRQIKKRNPPTCHICQKNFSQRGNLKVHIKTVHLKERLFSCGICSKAFFRKDTLQTHMRYHNGERPYTFSHCQKGFTQSGDLRKHVRAVHEMEKPHTCGECGKAFSHKHHIKTHMLVHTGERPHTCDICSRSFSLKQDLKTHMVIHTGEKPHTCTLCSKTFRHNGNLKRHMATHARKVPHP